MFFLCIAMASFHDRHSSLSIQRTGEFLPFLGLCFLDFLYIPCSMVTLDNAQRLVVLLTQFLVTMLDRRIKEYSM